MQSIPALIKCGAGSLVTAAMPDAALTCLDFWCRGGSAWEQRGEEGIAHFLEHMVFKGSRRLGPGEFDRRIEALGGSSNAVQGSAAAHPRGPLGGAQRLQRRRRKGHSQSKSEEVSLQ